MDAANVLVGIDFNEAVQYLSAIMEDENKASWIRNTAIDVLLNIASDVVVGYIVKKRGK